MATLWFSPSDVRVIMDGVEATYRFTSPIADFAGFAGVANMSPSEGLVKFTAKQLNRMESALVRVMTTRDVECVHELRVSSRRLSEPLELIGGLISERKCREHRDTLSEIRGSLRFVRDVDVLRMALVSQQQSNASLHPSDHAKLIGVLAIQRENELIAARHTIQTLGVKRVHRDIFALCKRVEQFDSKRERKMLLRAVNCLWKRKAQALIERAPARELGPGLHKTRIRLKALRYSTELIARLDGTNRDDLLHACAGMQDRLGAWNDHFSAARLLTAIAQDETTLAAGPQWSATVLEYAAERARQMDRELDDLLREWPRLRMAIESRVLGRIESEGATVPRNVAADTRHALERV